MTNTYERMQRVFCNVFDEDALLLRPEMTAADVENWDSLSHLDMLVSIEREFKVRFTTAEVSSLNCVGDFAVLVDKKRAAAGS